MVDAVTDFTTDLCLLCKVVGQPPVGGCDPPCKPSVHLPFRGVGGICDESVPMDTVSVLTSRSDMVTPFTSGFQCECKLRDQIGWPGCPTPARRNPRWRERRAGETLTRRELAVLTAGNRLTQPLGRRSETGALSGASGRETRGHLVTVLTCRWRRECKNQGQHQLGANRRRRIPGVQRLEFMA